MPYRQNAFIKDQYYHIYNRDAGRHPIFYDVGNYRYLVQLIERFHRRYGAAVIAYCMMPNHYHFLVRQETDLP